MARPAPPDVWETEEWAALAAHAAELQRDEGSHLRTLLQDDARCAALRTAFDGVLLDYSRQKMTVATREMLLDLAKRARLGDKLQAMAAGKFINTTEGRAVGHMALRAPQGKVMMMGGTDVVKDVHEVLERIFAFAEAVRGGRHLGAAGKKLVNVVSIGIGGSYLGPEFVAEALRTDAASAVGAEGRTLRFLANVDPVDVSRALQGLDPHETLVIVVSKTFTTAETMLNARSLKRWLAEAAGGAAVDTAEMLSKHMVAVSSNVPAAQEFGIDAANVFGFWDWVGGRYSVCSAVGVVPLALQYGRGPVEAFLQGAHQVDEHFCSAPLESNLPALLGLLGVWNSTFLGHGVRALLPYSQALLRFPAHIQQVDMESNGKRVSIDGKVLPFAAGEVNFGEPGTNGQHSFYQLLHQGRVCPCDFIGSVVSQQPLDASPADEKVSNHDELMSNFFAQPDALAAGKTQAQLKEEGVPEALWPHKEFPGDRPSSSLLFPCFDARRVGQLLAIYEHRSAVQGFVWNINSFDQWGVELGKVLASQVRSQLVDCRKNNADVKGFNSSTAYMLNFYLGKH